MRSGSDDKPRFTKRGYRNPDGGPLQISPWLQREDFDNEDDYWAYFDELSRFNNNLRPRPRPHGEPGNPRVPAPDGSAPSRDERSISRQVGIRLARSDYELLGELARSHSVPTATMARILVARGVRAAFD